MVYLLGRSVSFQTEVVISAILPVFRQFPKPKFSVLNGPAIGASLYYEIFTVGNSYGCSQLSNCSHLA